VLPGGRGLAGGGGGARVRGVHGGDGEIRGGKNPSRRGEAERSGAVVVSIQGSGVSFCFLGFGLPGKKETDKERRGRVRFGVVRQLGRT